MLLLDADGFVIAGRYEDSRGRDRGDDLGARLAGGIPVGIVTALIGAPFFLWLLRRSLGLPHA